MRRSKGEKRIQGHDVDGCGEGGCPVPGRGERCVGGAAGGGILRRWRAVGWGGRVIRARIAIVYDERGEVAERVSLCGPVCEHR